MSYRTADYYMVGFARALERRSKQAKQQTNVEKVDNNTTKTTTAIITTTQLDRDEEYRATTIQNMLNYINQKREETNHD